MTKWLINRVQWLHDLFIIAYTGIGYGKIAYLSHIGEKAAGDINRRELHLMLSKVKVVLTAEYSPLNIERKNQIHL